jgi:hypothetical protein
MEAKRHLRDTCVFFGLVALQGLTGTADWLTAAPYGIMAKLDLSNRIVSEFPKVYLQIGCSFHFEKNSSAASERNLALKNIGLKLEWSKMALTSRSISVTASS